MQEVFEKIKQFIHKEIDRTSSFVEHDTQCNILHFVEGLEEEYHNILSDEYINRQQAIDAVAQSYSYESERMTALQELPVVNIPKNNGWIPVEEGLPDEEDSVFAKYKGTDIWSDTMFEKNSKEVQVIVSDSYGNCVTKVAHTVDGKWKCDFLKFSVDYKIIAWQPLPEPYQPKGEKE